MDVKEALDLIEKREFVFVSVSRRRDCEVSERSPFGFTFDRVSFIVVGTASVPRARKIARAHAALNFWAPDEIDLYTRNYIKDTRNKVQWGEAWEWVVAP